MSSLSPLTSLPSLSSLLSLQGVANIRIFEYIRIFSGTNIRSYHIRIIFLYKYIWIFVRMAQIVHALFDILSLLLCQLCFNILLYHTSKIQHLKSNLKRTSKIWYECICKFKYFLIRIFIRIIFLIWIYSEIRLYHYFYMNIFGYSFV